MSAVAFGCQLLRCTATHFDSLHLFECKWVVVWFFRHTFCWHGHDYCCCCVGYVDMILSVCVEDLHKLHFLSMTICRFVPSYTAVEACNRFAIFGLHYRVINKDRNKGFKFVRKSFQYQWAQDVQGTSRVRPNHVPSSRSKMDDPRTSGDVSKMDVSWTSNKYKILSQAWKFQRFDWLKMSAYFTSLRGIKTLICLRDCYWIKTLNSQW